MKVGRRRMSLRLGFLPESDCAPIVLAQELGFFSQHGLNVQLQAQPSWKHIHDGVIHGELDAVHAPSTLPFLISLGLTPEKAPCVTGMVLSLEGNAITVSRELWEQGVRDAVSLREHLWGNRNKRRYTFGVTWPLSPQYALFCDWLKSAHGPPCPNIRIETIAPEQLFPLLKLGYLDGYCAAEPWNSVAVQAGVGACLATSAGLAPLHPEKVLLVRKEFAETYPDEHERLIAAVLQACRFCEMPQNRRSAAAVLARPQYVNAPIECLLPGLKCAPEAANRAGLPHGVSVFYGTGVNQPTGVKAGWVTGRLFAFLRWSIRPAELKNIFLADVFQRAARKVRRPGGRPQPGAPAGLKPATGEEWASLVN